MSAENTSAILKLGNSNIVLPTGLSLGDDTLIIHDNWFDSICVHAVVWHAVLVWLLSVDFSHTKEWAMVLGGWHTKWQSELWGTECCRRLRTVAFWGAEVSVIKSFDWQ